MRFINMIYDKYFFSPQERLQLQLMYAKQIRIGNFFYAFSNHVSLILRVGCSRRSLHMNFQD